jgi:aspartate/methionine/tyrosine aminotransferase
MFVKSSNRLDDENSIFASAGIQLGANNLNNPSVLNETPNYSTYDPSVNTSKVITPQNELEETKRQIEELKKSIQNYDSEISKLNVQLNNYSSNSMLFKTKNKGK